MKKSSVVLVLVLMVAIVAVVSVTFAVWDSIDGADKGIGVNIGSNKYVFIKESTPFKELSKKLLPSGAIRGINDVYEYTGATFTVVHGDATNKSILHIKLSVTTDGKINVTSFFDLKLAAVTEGASVSMNSKNANIGAIVVPLSAVSDNGEGRAIFSLGMSFKDNATDIIGFDNIVGRNFSVNIDISLS